MNNINLCLCFLIVAGAFTLICLGVLLLKTASMMKEVTDVTSDLKFTVTKVNTTLDDVNYKLEKLNAPVEVVNNFFEKKKASPGVFGTIMNLVTGFRSK